MGIWVGGGTLEIMHSGGVWEGPWSLVSVTRMITPWMDQSYGMGPQDDSRWSRVMCCAVLSRSVVSNSFATPWTVASVHGIFQARILEWAAIPFSSRKE